MPELPEVQTTVDGLNRTVSGLRIKDVWTDFHKNSKHTKKSESIKNPTYFKRLREQILEQKITKAQRRGKNILIKISKNQTLIIHMKMTGHFLYGEYKYNKKEDSWKANEDRLLKDPFSRFIHFVITFSNGKHLAFSDMRKFGKIILVENKNLENHPDLKRLGPEPLEKEFTFEVFKKIILKNINRKIKQAITKQEVVVGVGNIYADEALWQAGIHPEELVRNISDEKLKGLWSSIKELLKKGVKLKGDSTSDYRNIDGKKGSFQKEHRAYQRAEKKCQKRGCSGMIKRIVVGGRGTHFCPTHQKLIIKQKK